MTATRPHLIPPTNVPRFVSRFCGRIGVAALVVLAVGCKGRDGPSGGYARGHDPIFGGRIPPQNVPVPDRDTAGAKGKVDPLMAPVGRDTNKTGAGYTNDPDRFRSGPYLPNLGTTPAALAGQRRDGEELKIETPGVPLRPAGGVVPSDEPDPAIQADALLQQLQTYGVTRGNYTFSRENGVIVFRARAPISGNGATREYAGSGATANEAVKQVLDQIRSDRGR